MKMSIPKKSMMSSTHRKRSGLSRTRILSLADCTLTATLVNAYRTRIMKTKTITHMMIR